MIAVVSQASKTWMSCLWYRLSISWGTLTMSMICFEIHDSSLAADHRKSSHKTLRDLASCGVGLVMRLIAKLNPAHVSTRFLSGATARLSR